MFSLIEEFLNDINFKTLSATKQKAFRYVNFNNEIFYIQNFKGILTLSGEEILIKLYDGELKIVGKNLKIKEISHKFLCVCGKIFKIEVDNA